MPLLDALVSKGENTSTARPPAGRRSPMPDIILLGQERNLRAGLRGSGLDKGGLRRTVTKCGKPPIA